MVSVFWGCLILGVLFTLVTIILGDVLSSAIDGAFEFISVDYLHPMILTSFITTFGGVGLMLTHYTPLTSMLVLTFTVFASFAVCVILYFGYVKPMKNSENSTAFSERDLSGRIAEVSIPIPLNGYGEVIMRVGAGVTNQIAASYDGEEHPADERVVVVQVRDSVLYVSRLENIE